VRSAWLHGILVASYRVVTSNVPQDGTEGMLASMLANVGYSVDGMLVTKPVNTEHNCRLPSLPWYRDSYSFFLTESWLNVPTVAYIVSPSYTTEYPING
jgi:hypothetical protein